MSKVRKSPVYDSYVDLAKRHDYKPMEDFDKLLLFTFGFNGVGGGIHYVGGLLAIIPKHPQLQKDLRAELRTTKITMANVDSFPLLDSVAYEALRYYFNPKIEVKRAKADLEIPAGDGRKYRVKKGQLVTVLVPLANRDESVWTNPNEFDGYRFLKNPKLLEKHFTFFYSFKNGPVEASKFGCGAHALGVAHRINKLKIAYMIQNIEWKLNGKADFSGDFVGGYGPDELGFAVLEPRQIKKVW